MIDLVNHINEKITELQIDKDDPERIKDVPLIYGRALDSLHLAIDEFYEIVEKKATYRELKKLDELYHKTGYYTMLDASLENSELCNLLGVLSKLTNVTDSFLEDLISEFWSSSISAINTAVKDLKGNVCDALDSKK